MKVFALALSLIVASAGLTFAQTIATTSDGKTVILKDDGTWSYVSKAAQTAETDFRKAAWGMNKAKIKVLEVAKPVEEQDGLLVFTGSISSLETYIGYFFTNDMLTRARYAISEKHSNNNDYIDDFKNLKTQLTKKYGSPSQDDTHWKSDLFKDTPDQWGMAIGLGNLSYYTTWATPRTQIVLALYGESYAAHLVVEYTSVDYGRLEEAQDLSNF